ncbi:MAG TPA: VRR-NUC domain-containing protein [Tepidisphaeraceae bacterium]|jgi:hypothetical protein
MSMSAAEFQATIREADFTEHVIAEAEAAGWLVYHIPDWMYRTAMAKWRDDGHRRGRWWPPRGFPDLILVRAHPPPPELLFVELKSRYGKQSVDQIAWRDALVACGQTVELWRPKDWHWIVARLAPKPKEGRE